MKRPDVERLFQHPRLVTTVASGLPVTRPRPKKWSSTSPKNVETANHRSFTRVSDSGWIRIRCTGESPDHGGPRFRRAEVSGCVCWQAPEGGCGYFDLWPDEGTW